MPGTDLLLFAELQAQRLRAALISAAPRQTFTAQPKIEVYHRTPAHRREYVTTTRATKPTTDDALHGTMQCYTQYGCRCGPCASANSAYRRTLRHRSQRATPAEHGTTKMYGRGCRCDACGFANHLYGKAWRAAHPKNNEAS